MRLIILAAGRGRRLGSLGANAPKTLIPLHEDTSLLENNLANARVSGIINEVVIVTGYMGEKIDELVSRLDLGFTLRTVYNPFYSLCGPLVSLWMAREEMLNNDFMIVNGDTFYSPDAFQEARCTEPTLRLLISIQSEFHDDEVKVELTQDGNVARVNKTIPNGNAEGVSTGAFVVTGTENRNKVISQLDASMRDGTALSKKTIWHSLVNMLAKQNPIQAQGIPRNSWHEVDNIEDYEDLLRTLQQ